MFQFINIHNTRHFKNDWSEQLQECYWVWVYQGLVPFRDDVTF